MRVRMTFTFYLIVAITLLTSQVAGATAQISYCKSCGPNPHEAKYVKSVNHVLNEEACASLCLKTLGCNYYEHRGDWAVEECFLMDLEENINCDQELSNESIHQHRSGVCTKPFQPTYKTDNGCILGGPWSPLTMEECKYYAEMTNLVLYDRFSGSWNNDCKGCVTDGVNVAFNTHENPRCANKWQSVCLELPHREPLEKVVGKFSVSNGEGRMEIGDGTVFTLMGLSRNDLATLKTDSGDKGHVLFEGYRRGIIRFEVVSWTAFDKGNPFAEYVDRTAPIEGQHTALVVRLRVNGRWPITTQDEIRSELFNSNGNDKWNINLFERCSYGQYKVVPFTGPYAGIATNGGVMDFDIGDHTETNVDDYIYFASYLLPYDDSVDFIMFVLPKGFEWDGAAAAARVNGRFSMYDDESIINPFTVGHELGHNLGLKHSADVSNGGEYGDHTCLMGNGYIREDVRGDYDENTHCFNTAKSWQLGWYADRRAQWSPTDGLQTFDLVGLGDYAHSNDKQVVDLEVTDMSGNKFYLGFNRKSGINSDIKEYADLVTVSLVIPTTAPEPPKDSGLKRKLSYLGKELDSRDWNHQWFVSEDFAIYVESIQIKPEGLASVARIILGTKEEILRVNQINNRPMNCIVDSEKSAPTCTEECGFVPGVAEDEGQAYFGGSCAEYECNMYDGNCTVGGKCGDKVLTPFYEELKKTDFFSNVTNHFCESWMQLPEYVLSNTTCVLNAEDSPVPMTFDIMVSEFHSFCTHDFSSKAKAGEEMEIKLTLTYTIEGTSNAQDHESSVQFANEIFAQNVADLLGEDSRSVKANIDREADKIEITFTTNYHADLELRVKHEWFLMRLQEQLSYDSVVANFGNLQFAISDLDEESFLEKYMLFLIGGVAGVVVFIIGLIVCLCVPCGNSPTIIHKRGPQVVRKRVNFNGAVLA